jgi:hypothetical protein
MVATLPGCSTRIALACLVTALLIPERASGATPAWRRSTDHGGSVGGPTVDVHDDLRARITRFQDEWRKLWEKARTTADGYLPTETLDDPNSRTDPRLRRRIALQCYEATPMLRDSWLPMRPVVTSPDRGAICPMWFPPGRAEPSNEGEAIDLSLRLTDRRRARALRDRLIGEIEAAHATYPTDDWIAGQRVRFVYDQAAPAQTLAAANACRGNAGWCAMLTGLAHAQADQLIDAESAFRQGEQLGAPLLDSMPFACAATPMLMLVPREEREAFTRAACASLSPVIDHAWWLSDPLWSVPGNERYVAHQARRTLIALRSILGRDERYVWDIYATGRSMRETVLRYGWPNYTFWATGKFESQLADRIDYAALGPTAAATQVKEFALPVTTSQRGNASRRGGAPTPKGGTSPLRLVRFPYTVKEYTTDQTALVPTLSAMLDPFRVRATDWVLTNPDPREPDGWWPHEFLQLKRPLALLGDGQLGSWRRDSTVRLAHIVALPVAVRNTLDSTTDMAVLAGGASPASTQIYGYAALTPNDALRFRGTVPSGRLVLSAELVTQTPRAANYRSRFGATAPSTLRDMPATARAISDPVFVRLPRRGLVPLTALDDVIEYMADSDQFHSTDSLALYWESYGFPERAPLEIALQVRSADGASVVQRLGTLIGVNGRPDSLSIRWTEQDPTRLVDAEATVRPVTMHSVGLDMSSLAPGAYVITIEVRTRDNQTARSERRFVLRKP